jgi:muramoyltetrapeptide carboxypeptidase
MTDLSIVRPPRLEPGDTIMFVAPAGDLDEEKMLRAEKRLEERGYRVVMRDDLFAVEGYLAGSDERRAGELMQAFNDPEVKAVFPGTGGYGTMRILDRLDYQAIRAHPKILVGFSDITALHLAIQRHAGLVTFHSPSPMWGLGNEDGLTPFSAEYFWKALERKRAVERRGYVIEIGDGVPQPVCLGKGRARGRLTGGNLSLISALEGTPFALDAEGAILLLEDTREAPYRVDRMLRQLQLAGKLTSLKGAVLGQFTRNFSREDETTDDPRYSVEGVLRQYFEPLGIPVLMNFPVGHHKMNATLPLGVPVVVDARRCELRILPDAAK